MAQAVRIKVCGVTTAADAEQAALLGADAVGLNFHPGSRRFIDDQTADAILRALPPLVEAVGIFVDVPLRQVYERLGPLGRIHTIQWYGQDRELCDCYPYHYIAAFGVRDADSLRQITRYLQACRLNGPGPSAVLADAYSSQHGGTGRRAPWPLLADFRPGVPLILAGGLTPDNVAEAIRVVRPYGVDVASGVESSPGRKDLEKVRRFIENAREAAARLGAASG
jgi:phosphoribosylanthranilate isomerase